MKTILKTAAVLLFCVICMSSCAGRYKTVKKDMFAMDTLVELKFVTMSDDTDKVLESAENIITYTERLLSKNYIGSDVYNINTNIKADISDISADILNRSFEITKATNGAYDITLEPVISLWNIGKKNFKVPSEDEIETAIESVGTDNFVIGTNSVEKKNVRSEIDLGGVGKGYALDTLVNYLKDNSEYGIISMGGNIGVYGMKPNGEKWKIAVNDPTNVKGAVGYFHIDEGYIAVSGGYQRYSEENGEIYHHIIDPKTGHPAKSDILSVAVYAKDGLLADALSTALFVMGADKALEFYKTSDYDFEAVMVLEDMTLALTDGLIQNGKFTTN